MYEYIVRQKLGVASRFDSVVSRRAIDPWFVVGVLLIAVHVLPVDKVRNVSAFIVSCPFHVEWVVK